MGAIIVFNSFDEWLGFVGGFSVVAEVPEIVRLKHALAQKLMLLAWFDFDLIKASELVAFSTLELALKDRYGPNASRIYAKRNQAAPPKLAHMLKYMVEHDGLSDDKLAIHTRCRGGTVVDLLIGRVEPSLAAIRNRAAHGDPFDGLPWSGLIEVIRDLIEYAYRDFIAEQRALRGA